MEHLYPNVTYNSLVRQSNFIYEENTCAIIYAKQSRESKDEKQSKGYLVVTDNMTRK